MKWSWKVLRVAGIGIYIHATFPLLLIWAAFIQYSVRHEWADAWFGVAFVLVLFAVVVLHELGHALTARRFGIPTRDITLLPIGGVARLERLPEEPKQELAVALAGPAVNVCLAVLLFAVLGVQHQVWAMTSMNFDLVGTNFLIALMWANIGLTVFNMLPAFPMDGGRVLRALLAMRWSYARATSIAAGIGQGVALLFAMLGVLAILTGVSGFFSNPFLLLIAVFVWVGAAQEAGMVRLKSALNRVPVSQMMLTGFHRLQADEPIRRAVELILGGWQHDFPVVQEGQLAGVLTRGRLAEALRTRGSETLVRQAMSGDYHTIEVGSTAEHAFQRFRQSAAAVLMVMHGPHLIGVLPRDEFLTWMRSAGARDA